MASVPIQFQFKSEMDFCLNAAPNPRKGKQSAPEMTSYMRAVLLAQPRMAKRVQGDSATHSTPPAGDGQKGFGR